MCVLLRILTKFSVNPYTNSTYQDPLVDAVTRVISNHLFSYVAVYRVNILLTIC